MCIYPGAEAAARPAAEPPAGSAGPAHAPFEHIPIHIYIYIYMHIPIYIYIYIYTIAPYLRRLRLPGGAGAGLPFEHFPDEGFIPL